MDITKDIRPLTEFKRDTARFDGRGVPASAFFEEFATHTAE